MHVVYIHAWYALRSKLPRGEYPRQNGMYVPLIAPDTLSANFFTSNYSFIAAPPLDAPHPPPRRCALLLIDPSRATFDFRQRLPLTEEACSIA